MAVLNVQPIYVAAGLGFLLAWALFRRTSKLPYPPGPYRWPVIGNVLEYPKERIWLKFSEWSKQYGDIVYLNVLGLPILILHSQTAAKELLDKRSAIYSDRPSAPMAELSGYSLAFAFQPYGDEWRRQRKLVSSHFASSAGSRYHFVQEKQARKLAVELVSDPERLDACIKLRIADIINRVTFGFYLSGEDDIFYIRPQRTMENFVKAVTPGMWLVDIFPFLKHLPKWTPGASFLRTATIWYQDVLDVSFEPFYQTKKSIANGTALTPSVCTDILTRSDAELSKDETFSAAFAASSALGGGLDTNVATIRTFFLMMMHHPAIQAKGHEEIIRVLGKDRLPDISDRPSLPYVRSIITEVLRYHPPATVGMPHSLVEDDTYNGMLIPKGSVILANIWHMLHDPENFSDPDEFKPERYQNSDVEMAKVTDLVFGFGRRVCPGSSFAEGTLFAVVSTVLATCEILPPLDEDGKEVLPEVAFCPEPLSPPVPYRCRVKYRSEVAQKLLQAVLV